MGPSGRGGLLSLRQEAVPSPAVRVLSVLCSAHRALPSLQPPAVLLLQPLRALALR